MAESADFSFGFDHHARPQQLHLFRGNVVEIDPHRNTLLHLDEVTGRIIRGHQRVFRSRRFRNGRYGAVESFVPERIDADTDFLSDENAGDLGLFVVCRDPFVLAADQVADRLSTLEQLPRL